jgi:hypothetical protein
MLFRRSFVSLVLAVTMLGNVCGRASETIAEPPAQRAKHPTSKEKQEALLTEIVEQLATEWLLVCHLEKDLRAWAIEILAATPDWPTDQRLARALMSSKLLARAVKGPAFEDFLAAKLEYELRTNRARLRIAGFCDSHVKFKARSIAARDRVEGALATRFKWEMKLNDAMTPETAANIVEVMSMLRTAESEELIGSRREVRNALRQALKDNPDALQSLADGRAKAARAEPIELKKSRERITKLIEEAKKK